jgi:hypothetical protein
LAAVSPWVTANQAVGSASGSYTLACSNPHPAGFDELVPKTIVISTDDSIRLTHVTRGKGVRPLTTDPAGRPVQRGR